MIELDDFLSEYEQAANSCDFDRVAPFISKDAVFWFTNGTFQGEEQIRRAFQETWSSIKDEKYTLSNRAWLVATSQIGVCIYQFTSDGLVDGRQQVYRGRGTNIIQKIDGKWQITHEHLSKLPE